MHRLAAPDAIADCVDRHVASFQRAAEHELVEPDERLEVRWVGGDGWCVSVLARREESDPTRSLLEVLETRESAVASLSSNPE
jgi:hypothetical protein